MRLLRLEEVAAKESNLITKRIPYFRGQLNKSGKDLQILSLRGISMSNHKRQSYPLMKTQGDLSLLNISNGLKLLRT